MVEFYLLTFPRFPLRKKEHKSYFGKNRTHDFRTSRCAGYLLDHSGDEERKCIYLHRLQYCNISCVCVCCVLFPFILDIKFVGRTRSSLDVPAGVTQEEGHRGFFIHFLSAVRAFPSSTVKSNLVY